MAKIKNFFGYFDAKSFLFYLKLLSNYFSFPAKISTFYAKSPAAVARSGFCMGGKTQALDQHMVQPLSTTRTWPLQPLPSSLAKNRMAWAWSSVVASGARGFM